MRRALVGLVAASLVVGVGIGAGRGKDKTDKKDKVEGTITVSGAWALYPMAVRWAEEFQKIHPKVRIDIGAGGAGKGMADCLAGIVDIGMVSRDIYPEEVKKGAWWVSVTEDAVVPTVSAGNPVLGDLMARGVSREVFIGLWVTGDVKTWGDVTGGGETAKVHVYTRSDACGAAETWASYMGKKQEDLIGVGVYGDPGLAEAVRQDALGVGFNNVNYAYDSKTKGQIDGLRVLPIDIDGDGKIDDQEDFYADRDQITSAIAQGKYPSPPARNLHFVCRGRPESKLVREFIRWVLTDGQRYVPESGYINLSDLTLAEQMRHLEGE